MDKETYANLVDRSLQHHKSDPGAVINDTMHIVEDWVEDSRRDVLKPEEFLLTATLFRAIESLGEDEWMATYTQIVAWMGYRQAQREAELERMVDGGHQVRE